LPPSVLVCMSPTAIFISTFLSAARCSTFCFYRYLQTYNGGENKQPFRCWIFGIWMGSYNVIDDPLDLSGYGRHRGGGGWWGKRDNPLFLVLSNANFDPLFRKPTLYYWHLWSHRWTNVYLCLPPFCEDGL
jgi:hypothetical protein